MAKVTDFFARVIAGMIPFRAVRRKVRHSLMQRTIEKRLDVVMERMTSLAAQIQVNQIMLASSCKDKYLTIANRTSSAQLCLHTTDSGKLCLTPPDPEKSQ